MPPALTDGLRYQKILSVCSFGGKNLLKTTCHSMIFHSRQHINGYKLRYDKHILSKYAETWQSNQLISKQRTMQSHRFIIMIVALTSSARLVIGHRPQAMQGMLYTHQDIRAVATQSGWTGSSPVFDKVQFKSFKMLLLLYDFPIQPPRFKKGIYGSDFSHNP